MSTLDQDTVAMISLVSGIAANHPAMGRCQLKRLRDQGVSEAKLTAVIEIARHIRDEANQELDHKFDEASKLAALAAVEEVPKAEGEGCSCTPTPTRQSCC